MDVDAVTEILIERPREEVAAFAGDPDNAPRSPVATRRSPAAESAR